MWFFKKKKEPVIIEPPPCRHVWKDFPSYLEAAYAHDEFEIYIKEPYVCIFCKKRQDRVLMHEVYRYISRAEADKIVKSTKKEYAWLLEPIAKIEDAIGDFQLVDRRKLELAEALKGTTPHEEPSKHRDTQP